LQAWLRRHRFKEARRAVQVRAIKGVAENQKSERAQQPREQLIGRFRRIFSFGPWNLYFLSRPRRFAGVGLQSFRPTVSSQDHWAEERGEPQPWQPAALSHSSRVNTMNRSYPLIPQGGTEKPR
jgi:hypothetical protein